VHGGAVAGGGVGDLAGVGLAVVDELLDGLGIAFATTSMFGTSMNIATGTVSCRKSKGRCL